MFDLINNDMLLEIMLRTTIEAFEHFCLVNKNIYNMCNDFIFWQSKLSYDVLPKIIINKRRTIYTYVNSLYEEDSNDDFLIGNVKSYIYLYTKMNMAYKYSKNIFLNCEWQ